MLQWRGLRRPVKSSAGRAQGRQQGGGDGDGGEGGVGGDGSTRGWGGGRAECEGEGDGKRWTRRASGGDREAEPRAEQRTDGRTNLERIFG